MRRAARHRVAEPVPYASGCTSLAFSQDGRQIATAHDDSIVRRWEAATLDALTPALRHDAPIESVAFSPKDDFVATASAAVARQTRPWQLR